MQRPGDSQDFERGAVAGSGGSGDRAEAGEAAAGGWFRFGDEPAGASPDPAAGPGDAPDAGGPAVSGADGGPAGRSAAGSAEPETTVDDEERFQPFVVSSTPGGVDPAAMPEADLQVAAGGSRRAGFGLVGMLTVVLALFGAGMLALTGPRAADAGATATSVKWLLDVDAGIARSQAEDKPLLILFTADWCPPCRAMRENVFASDAVQRRLGESFVAVKVDLTDRGGPNTGVARRFGVGGIPAIQVYHPDGYELRRFGYVATAGDFIGRLGDAEQAAR